MKKKNLNIICVAKTPDLTRRLRTLFPNRTVKVNLQKSIDKVVECFEQEAYDVLILSSAALASGDKDAIDLLELISAKCPGTQVLFLVEPNRMRLAMSALKAGSYHYARLPIADQELKLLVETALEQRPEYAPNLLLKEEVEQTKFEQMVGGSSAMHQIYRQIRQAAATEIPVFISGETGTGKDLAAQAIHQLSSRKDHPYMPVHLGALPQDLVASELFGHEKGAFTGAAERYRGSFEQANGGTVFLDEISTVSEKVQVSLLRLLEASEFYRMGGRKRIKSDVRVMAASNEDLQDAVNRGTFRQDLYFRLEVLQINMPPLRERHGDMLLLLEHFINNYSLAHGKNILGVSPECLSMLSNYDWPGNVRELKNVILRAVVHCQSEVILPELLTDRIRYGNPKVPMISLPVGKPLAEIERETILRTLEYTGYNKKRTAEILDISRRALYNKIDKYRI